MIRYISVFSLSTLSSRTFEKSILPTLSNSNANPLTCGYTFNVLLLMAMQFQEIIVLLLHKKFCVWHVLCWQYNNFRKIAEKLKTLNILITFLLANFAGIPCSHVASFFRAIATQQFLKITLQSRVKNCPCSRSFKAISSTKHEWMITQKMMDQERYRRLYREPLRF